MKLMKLMNRKYSTVMRPRLIWRDSDRRKRVVDHTVLEAKANGNSFRAVEEEHRALNVPIGKSGKGRERCEGRSGRDQS